MLFPEIEPKEQGILKVSPLHSIYWERSGNPNGSSVLIVHGGPGGGSSPSLEDILTQRNSILFNLIKEDAVDLLLILS